MEVSLIVESAFRFVIAAEFMFLSVAGAAALAHVVMMDAQLRKLTAEQQEMLDGMLDAISKKDEERKQKRQSRLDALDGTVAG